MLAGLQSLSPPPTPPSLLRPEAGVSLEKVGEPGLVLLQVRSSTAPAKNLGSEPRVGKCGPRGSRAGGMRGREREARTLPVNTCPDIIQSFHSQRAKSSL